MALISFSFEPIPPAHLTMNTMNSKSFCSSIDFLEDTMLGSRYRGMSPINKAPRDGNAAVGTVRRAASQATSARPAAVCIVNGIL